MSIEILTLGANELEVARSILDGAYGPSPGRAERLGRYVGIEPEGWFLAYADGRAVGIGGALDFVEHTYVGLVGVLPDAQRGGVGRALMAHILAWIERRACPTVLLDASEAGEPLYRRLGFVEVDSSRIFAKVRIGPRAHAAPDGGVRLAPLVERDLDDVALLDRRVTGGSRRRLLEAYLRDFADRAIVARDRAGAICGYVVAQRYTIGPWVATDDATAGELLDAALGHAFDAAPSIAVPMENPYAEAVLVRRGFTPTRSLAHMQLGDEPDRRRDFLFGQASLAAG